MGTTQRISPGVPGQPNWGNLNTAVTNVAKTVEQEQEIERQTGEDVENAADYNRILLRRSAQLRSVYRNLISSAGGRARVSGGSSGSIGRAGLRSAGRMSGFFASVGANGLQAALAETGFEGLTGSSMQEVLDHLLLYCSEANTGMDETAANKASCEVLSELAKQAGNDLDQFEALLKDYVDGKGLPDLLCRFWGNYIFEHLSQRFQEKITQQKGREISLETFRIIKEDILGQVKILNDQRPVTRINWRGAEGKTEIERIFVSIINIIGDGNNG